MSCAGRGDVGRGNHGRVEHAGRGALQRVQRRAAAVGYCRENDARVFLRKRRLIGKGPAQKVQREQRRGNGVVAPAGLGVDAGMRVRHRDQRRGRAIRRAIGFESEPRRAALGAGPVKRHARIGGVVENVGAGALVGIGHRAAAWERPGAGDGQPAVDPARARSGCHHQARVSGIEAVRQLQRYPERLIAHAEPGERVEFPAGNFGQRRAGVEPAGGGQVDQALVIGVNRQPSQQCAAIHAAVSHPGRRAAQAGQAKTGGQQVVAIPMRRFTNPGQLHVRFRPGCGFGPGRGCGGTVADAGGEQQQGEGGRARLFHGESWIRADLRI